MGAVRQSKWSKATFMLKIWRFLFGNIIGSSESMKDNTVSSHSLLNSSLSHDNNDFFKKKISPALDIVKTLYLLKLTTY